LPFIHKNIVGKQVGSVIQVIALENKHKTKAAKQQNNDESFEMKRGVK